MPNAHPRSTHKPLALHVAATDPRAKGKMMTPEDVIARVHEQLQQDLKEAHLDAIYYCAHHPTVGEVPYRVDCDCRKPKPGLIDRAAQEFEIDRGASWMVGDRYGDVELAHNAGLRSAFVLSGYGLGEWEYQRSSWKHQPDLVCENLLEAVKMIVAHR